MELARPAYLAAFDRHSLALPVDDFGSALSAFEALIGDAVYAQSPKMKVSRLLNLSYCHCFQIQTAFLLQLTDYQIVNTYSNRSNTK
jgi:hypothetical protein